MHGIRRAGAILLLALTLGAASAGEGPPPAVLDALLPDGRTTVALQALEARAPLGPGEDLRVIEIGRDAHSSHHVVSIRDREVPHRHDQHDLLVVMLAGAGFMQLGDSERAVGTGSILYVPRGTLHAFRNTSPEPAVAYAVYLPAFDGKDRQTNQEPARP